MPETMRRVLDVWKMISTENAAALRATIRRESGAGVRGTTMMNMTTILTSARSAGPVHAVR